MVEISDTKYKSLWWRRHRKRKLVGCGRSVRHIDSIDRGWIIFKVDYWKKYMNGMRETLVIEINSFACISRHTCGKIRIFLQYGLWLKPQFLFICFAWEMNIFWNAVFLFRSNECLSCQGRHFLFTSFHLFRSIEVDIGLPKF